MRRSIIISDIHGCLNTFEALLDKLNFRSEQDQLILLGDYCDRGPDSKGVIAKVMELVNEHHAIALKGNHDQRLVDLVVSDNEVVRAKFIQHGGLQTIQSYTPHQDDIDHFAAYIRQSYMEHIHFLQQLPLYYEDDQHIYVHAGINPQYAVNWKNQSAYDFMYSKHEFIDANFHLGKRIVFGHTKVIDISGSADIWFHNDKIGIDGGCAYGLQLNALIYNDETGEYDTLSVSYRNEEA